MDFVNFNDNRKILAAAVAAEMKVREESALMEEAPNLVSDEQLDELGIKILDDEKNV